MQNQRRNINRGYKKLEVWQDSIDLYALTCKIFFKMPYILNKVAANCIDASHSVPRNIAEGYCRKGLGEYINFLFYSLGSLGELHSGMVACKTASQLSEKQFEELDALHYKVENKLLKLIVSLQVKKKSGNWEQSFASNQN